MSLSDTVWPLVAPSAARGYLTRIPRVFGDGGGSHGWIYQLGRWGWVFAERAGTYKKAYKPNWHALMVADIYCDLLEASGAGRYVLAGFELEVERTPADEPNSHVLRSLDNKCRAYWQASRAYGGDFPAVLFAVPDAEHMRRVRNATNAGPEGSAALFDVCLAEDVEKVVDKYLSFRHGRSARVMTQRLVWE